jgi:hypothetical protein
MLYEMIDGAIVVRFWSKVDQRGGADACWPWMGGRKAKGYGNFFVKRETPTASARMIFVNAHKFAYVATNGNIADGLVVRHTCNNPPCCNPAHLIPGTQKMNIADAIRSGRIDFVEQGRRYGPKGGRVNGQRTARLTDTQVLSLIHARAKGFTVASLAKEFRTDQSLIFYILQGYTYRWIPLVQRLHDLYALGIRFPNTSRKDYSIDLLHPLLRAAIDDLG